MTPAGRGRWVLLAFLLIVSAGCSGGDVPEGWQRFDAGGLRGAHPPDWQPRPEQRRVWPEAALEVAGPDGGLLEPVLKVYASDGPALGFEGRAAIVTNQMASELDATLVERTDLQVPGATEGLVMEFTFDAEIPAGTGASEASASAQVDAADPVPSRQFEVVIDAGDGRTFDLLLGGPADVLDQATVDRVLDSLHIR